MTLVDTCVLLDIVQSDPSWADWSLAQLELAADRGPLLINPVIYAEFTAGYPTIESAEAALKAFGTRLEEVPREARFLPGRPIASTASAEGRALACWPTSSSAATRRCATCPC